MSIISREPQKVLEGDAYEIRVIKCGSCGHVMPAAAFPKQNQDQNPIHRPRCGLCGSMMTYPVQTDNPGIGGGKYENECYRALYDCAAAGVILCVFGGNKGNGFSVAAPPEICMKIPQILRSIADGIEQTTKAAKLS
jgi:hypothetical protein